MSDYLTADSSAQLKAPTDQMWWLGGNQQGPAPATNPIRQWLGNVVETIGDAIPGREGYWSERIAGGPTAHTGYSYATDEGTVNPSSPLVLDYNNLNPDKTNTSPTGGTPTGGTPSGGYNFNMADFGNYAGWDPNAAKQDWVAKGSPAPGGSSGGGGVDPNIAIRNQLSSAWDNYFSSLDQQYEGLPGQAQDMQGIAQNSYNQSVMDIGTNEAENMADINVEKRKNQENQVKSLRDIADNIRNLYRSGNIYLGSRGAGDSSAANQYSYATTKLGSKQRGGVLEQTRSIANEIADREAKLGRLVLTEKAKIKTELDNKVLEISQWLKGMQEQVKGMRANGELQKGQSLAQLSQSLLDQATSRLMGLETQAKERENALISWATSNASSIGQLKQNLAEVSNITATNPVFSKLSGSPQVDAQGNMNTYWSSNNKEEDKNIYGR